MVRTKLIFWLFLYFLLLISDMMSVFRLSVCVLFAAWTGLHHHIRELLVHNIQ